MDLASIVILLQVAFGLLVNAQNPTVAPEVRAQAVQFAGSAVALAVQAVEAMKVPEGSAAPVSNNSGEVSRVSPAAPVAPQEASPAAPAPVVTDISITTAQGVHYPNGYRLQASGEAFKIDTMVVAFADQSKVSPFVSTGMYRGTEGKGIVGLLHVFSCGAANYYTSSTLAYPCPDGGYVAVAKDWQGYQRFTFTLTPGTAQSIEVPESASLVYLRAVGQSTGKVIEKTL